jgi:hypothetical protein
MTRHTHDSPYDESMTAAREELHRLIDALPDAQVAAASAELRRRLGEGRPAAHWPPEFFGIIGGADVPSDVASNTDHYLSAYGFGVDTR